MRFGIHLPNSGALSPVADLVPMARRAEDLGFDAVWVFDHLFNPASDLDPRSDYRGGTAYHNRADMPYYDAITTLSVIAGATTRIRLGTRVLIAAYRHPIALAKQIGTLCALGGQGRVLLGVGAGWMFEEFDALDMDFDDRFSRLDEHVAVMRQAWTGVSAWEGKHYHHVEAGFRPVPDPPVPVIVGGKGPGVYRRVARWADGFALLGPTEGADAAEELKSTLESLRKACDDAGRDYDELLLVGSANLTASRGAPRPAGRGRHRPRRPGAHRRQPAGHGRGRALHGGRGAALRALGPGPTDGRHAGLLVRSRVSPWR